MEVRTQWTHHYGMLEQALNEVLPRLGFNILSPVHRP
jgi:hypothetical protein